MKSSEILSTDRIVVCDGAMGTMIHSRGIELGQSFDEVNLSQPTIVEQIHNSYIDAGAEIIETNTFGANRLKLEGYGLGYRVRDINISGAQIAKRCAGNRVLVAGSVGPTGRLMKPFGPLDFDMAYEVYREQISALCEGGADLIIIETMQDLREAKAALLATRTVTEVPVICQMSFAQEGKSMMGTSPATTAVVLSAMGADLVGANCGTGPQDMFEAISAMAQVTDTKLIAQPNAGLPRFIDGRLMYLSTPQYIGDFAKQFVKAGAAIVGGCCGTTPDHIRAIASAVAGMQATSRVSDGVLRVASRTSLLEIGTSMPVLLGSRTGCGFGGDQEGGVGNKSFQGVQDEIEGLFQNGADIICLDCDVKPDQVRRLVELAQTSCPAPLCLVGSDTTALEDGLRAVEGRALVTLRDSVARVIETLFPIARRYGAAVIVCVDTGGGGTVEDRLRISRRAVQAAEQSGLDKSGVVIGLGSLFAEKGEVCHESFKAIKLIKSDLGVRVAVEYRCSDPSGDIAMSALRGALESGADMLIADPFAEEVKAVTCGTDIGD